MTAPTQDNIVLKLGTHQTREDGMCVMEAVAYIAGEPHSDHPVCVSEVITSFMVQWNDDLPTDDDRGRLLADLIPRMIGTRTTEADDIVRSYMVLDWLVRVHLPMWLDLTPTLSPHATALRACAELVDAVAVNVASGEINAARNAARNAVGDAAWDAAWDAASAAVGDAAGDAASAAASAAAWAAASAAVGAAASAAVGACLAPTVTILQQSARELVIRMCAVGRKEAPND